MVIDLGQSQTVIGTVTFEFPASLDPLISIRNPVLNVALYPR